MADVLNSIEMEIIRKEAEADALMSVKQIIEGMTEPTEFPTEDRNGSGHKFPEIGRLHPLAARPVPKVEPVQLPPLTDRKPDAVPIPVEARVVGEEKAEPPTSAYDRRALIRERLDKIVLLLGQCETATAERLAREVGMRLSNLGTMLTECGSDWIVRIQRGLYGLTERGRGRLTVLQMKGMNGATTG